MLLQVKILKILKRSLLKMLSQFLLQLLNVVLSIGSSFGKTITASLSYAVVVIVAVLLTEV